jgi:hypothetical protein
MRALANDFLSKARIKRFGPARTNMEMREITKLFLVLNCLKGHGGLEIIKVSKEGNPVVRDFPMRDFKVKRERDTITVSYRFEDKHELLECYLTFDRQGNVIEGRANGGVKAQLL